MSVDVSKEEKMSKISFELNANDFAAMGIVGAILDTITQANGFPCPTPDHLDGRVNGMFARTYNIKGKAQSGNLRFKFSMPEIDVQGKPGEQGQLTHAPNVHLEVQVGFQVPRTYEYSLITLKKENGEWIVTDLGPVTVDGTYTADTKPHAPVGPSLAAG